MQRIPPANGNNSRGYQNLGSPAGFEQQSSNNWKGVFSVSSCTQYFNVETDTALNRLMRSLYPTSGDFVSKIHANPDLYELVRISTTLVFLPASLGNRASYLMRKHADSSSSWTFCCQLCTLAWLHPRVMVLADCGGSGVLLLTAQHGGVQRLS